VFGIGIVALPKLVVAIDMLDCMTVVAKSVEVREAAHDRALDDVPGFVSRARDLGPPGKACNPRLPRFSAND